MIRVQVIYEPNLYREVLAHALEQTGLIEVVTDPAVAVDIVIFPLNEESQSHADWLPALPPDAKLIAASANGDRGLIWVPGESEWQEIRPFGLDELILEVLAGRDCPVTKFDRTSTSNEVDQIPQ